MGTILSTADDEPLWSHEGYVSAILDDGRSTRGA